MAKKALRKRSLLEKAPDDEESNLIHSMWTKEMSYISTYHQQVTNLFQLPLTLHPRPASPRHPPSKPNFHERHRPQISHDHATPRPQPTQLHDLRRLPPQANL